MFRSEAELQSLMWAAINDETLSEIIVDEAGLLTFVESQETMFPQFSIDHLVRRACLRVGGMVLDSFNLLLPVVEDKNISIAAQERMRPDIVCINPELETVIIFELKKEGQTGRQALTELLAYEHEIKNLLPFLSNYDVHFVLVSPEWTTLMDHSVASAIAWSGRKVLCLEANLANGALGLKTRVPLAWTITGSVYFPPDALPSVTICLYEKDAYSEKNRDKREIEKSEDLDPRIWTAMEVIAREGDRMGGHGFALLWRDHLGISLTSYNITLVGVAPFPFYRESRRRQNIADNANELVRKLDEHLNDHEPSGHSASLMAAAVVANPLLKEVSDPMLEGFSIWASDIVGLRKRAEPLLCEFWGELGSFARAYVMNPAVREHRRNTLANGIGDWRNPSVGLPLIASFTKPDIFRDGEVRCSDAFRLGILFGLDRSTRLSLRAGAQHKSIDCLFQWNRIELMAAMDEVRLLADAATNVAPPDEPLKFYDDANIDDDADNDRAMGWLVEQFFQNSRTHARFFEIGVNGALVFDNEREGLFRETPHQKYIDPVLEPVKLIAAETLDLYSKLVAENSLPPQVQNRFRILLRSLDLPESFSQDQVRNLSFEAIISGWDALLEAVDSVISAVFHKHSPVAPSAIDWPWLRQGVSEMRKRGIADAGVILLANGQIVTGSVSPEGVSFPLSIDVSLDQVPYMDRSNGFDFVRVTTWLELKAIFDGGSSQKFHEHEPGVVANAPLPGYRYTPRT